jgi:hypothetical protein
MLVVVVNSIWYLSVRTRERLSFRYPFFGIQSLLYYIPTMDAPYFPMNISFVATFGELRISSNRGYLTMPLIKTPLFMVYDN